MDAVGVENPLLMLLKLSTKQVTKGNYKKARGYLSIHSQMAMEYMKPLPGMPSFEEQMDAATKEGTIARIEIKGGEKFDHQAVVYLTLYYKDGSQEQDAITLLKGDGKRIWENSG